MRRLLPFICSISCVLTFSSVAEEGERRFIAKEVYDDSGPILYQSDFGRTGFDKLSLSEDGRYHLQAPNPERLEIVAAPILADERKAVRFTVPRMPNSYRSEISLPSEKGFTERWYGISLLIPKDWQVDPNRGADIVMQWHGIPGNWKATYPNLAIAIRNENWLVRQSFGSPQEGPDRKTSVLSEPVKTGVWSSWIIHAKWSPDESGLIRIWKDGSLVFESMGPNVYGTIGMAYTPYLKTGIYHPEWNLISKEHEERFRADIPGIDKKEVYVSSVIVGSEDANFDLISKALGDSSEPATSPAK